MPASFDDSQQQREWLRVTLGSIGDAVITTDPEGRVTFLNPVAESLTGWSHEQAADRPLTEVFNIVNEKTRRTVENAVARVIATGHIVGLANHTVLIARDGTERAIDDSAAPIRDSQGTVSGVVLVFRDVTERRRAEKTARFLASIVESSDDAIIGKDVNGIITSWNRSAERLFGYSAAEAVGRSISMLAPPDRVDEMPALLARIRQGERVEHFDTVRRAKDGTLLPISLTVSPVRDEEGHIVGASKIARDVSERKRAEETLREEKARLHATLTGIGDAVIVTDAESRVTLMNPVAQALTGWNDDAAGRPLKELFRIVNEQTRQPAENPVDRVMREGTIVGLANHTVLIARDDTERPIDDSAAPIKDAQGRVVGVVLVFRDVTERRVAERTAHLLASIVESSDDAIIGKDVNGIITSWNRAAERLFGYSAAEAVGRPVSMLAPPDRVDEMPALLARIRQRERVEHFDTVRRAKDGRLLPISLTVSPTRGEDGNIVGASKIARDISERKKAEETLREERARLHATLTGIGDAVVVTDAESRITLMNPVAQALTGWKEETAGRPLGEVFRIINEQTREPAENPVDRVVREGTVVGLANHTLLIARDGAERPIDDSAAPIKDAEGHVVGVVLVFRDNTERRRAEEALRLMHEQLQIVTESMAAPVTQCSRDFKYLWVSKPYADWIGRPTDEIVGRPIIDILGREAFEQLRPRFEQVLSGIKVQYEEEVNYRGLGIRWVNATYSPTFDAAGVPDGWVAAVHDNTDSKRAEKSLQEADRRKDEFLATLAHELRNPLAPISNAVALMRRADGETAILEDARSLLERQVALMVRLVDDLLEISRITRGKLQLRKERVELSTVVRSAVEAARPLIDAQAHQLTVKLPSEPIHLDADPIRLAQVFSNLLTNAAKYTEKGGHIWLTAERQDNEAVIAVRDTGIGIAAEHLPRLFQMFSQVEPALERSQGGLGIGLSLVKGLMELHGGRVEARSAGPGKGSEFIVRMATTDAPEPVPAAPIKLGKFRSGPQRRILVVDDNRDAADSLVLILGMMGHETATAYDGLEAVQSAAVFVPDVALLDIGLPKMNGYEVAHYIRKQPWGTRIVLIALTGWGQEEDKRRALEAGFDHHLTKPVDAAALEKLLAIINPAPDAEKYTGGA